MDREQGIAEIEAAKWQGPNDMGTIDFVVHDAAGRRVLCWLQLRPRYCDRGHVLFNLSGLDDIDEADSFPRYFFTLEEADTHVRNFLKWRLWKEGSHPGTLDGLLTQLDRVPVS